MASDHTSISGSHEAARVTPGQTGGVKSQELVYEHIGCDGPRINLG
jgi:hypothetical protein